VDCWQGACTLNEFTISCLRSRSRSKLHSKQTKIDLNMKTSKSTTLTNSIMILWRRRCSIRCSILVFRFIGDSLFSICRPPKKASELRVKRFWTRSCSVRRPITTMTFKRWSNRRNRKSLKECRTSRIMAAKIRIWMITTKRMAKKEEKTKKIP
jgi:hypothetical protein